MSGFFPHSGDNQHREQQRQPGDTGDRNPFSEETGNPTPPTPDIARHIFEHGAEASQVPNSSRLTGLLRMVRGRNSPSDTPATNTTPGSPSPEGARETPPGLAIQRPTAYSVERGDRSRNPYSDRTPLHRTTLDDLIHRQAPSDNELSITFFTPNDHNTLFRAGQDNDWLSDGATTIAVNEVMEENREELHSNNDRSENNTDRDSDTNSESDVVTIGDSYRAHEERKNRLENMFSLHKTSNNLIAPLEELYGDNIIFQRMKRYIEQEGIKIKVLESDLDKTETQRLEEINRWKNKKRADRQQSRDYEDIGSLTNIFSSILGIRGSNGHSRPKESSTIRQQLLRPIRAYQHREGHRLQAIFGSAERTPLQDQEFPGRNWQQKNINALTREIHERAVLLEYLHQARGAGNGQESPSQKYSPFEQRRLDQISNAIDRYSGRSATTGYISDKLLPASVGHADKSARQRRREEIMLLKQDLRLRTRVGEGDIDEQKARAAAREDMFDLPTSTLKKTARLLLKEKNYRTQEQQQNASSDIRQGKTTLFEREAREHAAFGINDKQLEILIEESIKELTSRIDAVKASIFLSDIQYESKLKDLEGKRNLRQFSTFLEQESSHITHTIKNMRWIRILRGKTPKKNKSIERALQKTVSTQRMALKSLHLGSSVEQEESIHSGQDLTAVTRTIMNLNWKREAFMWEHLRRGPAVTDESQHGLERYGVQLINALSNHEIQVLLQRHRRYTDYHQRELFRMRGLCESVKNDIAREEKNGSLDEVNRLRHKLEMHKKEREKRLSALNTYREHTRSFLDLVAKSHYQNLIIYEESVPIMLEDWPPEIIV